MLPRSRSDGFDDPGETLGEDRVQGDFAQIVQQSADKGLGGADTDCRGRGPPGLRRAIRRSRRRRWNVSRIPRVRKCVGIGWGRESFENRDGQDGAAHGVKAEHNHGAVEGVDFAANAG